MSSAMVRGGGMIRDMERIVENMSNTMERRIKDDKWGFEEGRGGN